MGSQTLEILRQGVLASLTGGWYYDVHQNVFCNAVHLYIWLFLLFLPFIIYMYFPTTVAVWSVYCVLIAIIITFFKMVNVALHRMYDRARTLSETNLKIKPGSGSGLGGVGSAGGGGGGLGGPGGSKVAHETGNDDDEPGIEMQILGTVQVGGGGGGVGGGSGRTPPANVSSRTSVEHQHSDENSYANSAISIDYQEQVTSTIDLKVDVHRKNSSESSDSGLSGAAGRHDSIPASAACSDTCFRSNHVAEANSETPYGPIAGSGSIVRCSTVQTHSADVCSTATHKRSLSTPNQERFSELVLETVVREMTREFGDMPKGGAEGARSKDHFPGSTGRMVGAQSNASLRRHQYKSKRKQRFMNSQLQRQISLDSEKLGMGADEHHGVAGGGGAAGVALGSGETSEGGARNRRQRGSGSVGGGTEGGLQLQRHLSSDDQSNKSIMSLFRNHQLHHHHHHHHHHHLLAMQNREPDLYMDHSYTKSAVQLASADPSGGNEVTGNGTATGYLLHQATPPIRRDSSSTMSALQLPTVASSSSSGAVGAGAIGANGGGSESGAGGTRKNAGNGGGGGGGGGGGAGGGDGVPSSSKRRRHSNTNNAAGSGSGTGRPMPRSLTSVRRIKSAALEICCSPASIPNLTPTHPNSVEVIGGQTLRNPRHTVLPPPSKSLSRNPYLNLFTKSNEGSSGSGLVDVCSGAGQAIAGAMAAGDAPGDGSNGGGGGEPVYPIAEQSDESTPIKSNASVGGGPLVLDDKTPVQRFDLHSDSDEGPEDDEDDDEEEEEEEEDDDEDEADDDDEEDGDDDEEDDDREEDVDVRGDQQLNSCGDRVEGASPHKTEDTDAEDGRKLHGRIADSEEDLTRHDQLRRLHHQQKQLQQQQRVPEATGADILPHDDDPGDESDLDPQDAGLQSTDSDTENNAGSRSPLLEPRAHRTNSEQLVGAGGVQGVSIVEAKNGSCCAVVSQKIGSEVKKTSSSPTISSTGGGAGAGAGAGGGDGLPHHHHHQLLRSTMKVFDEMGCHSSSDWEQASASSKDLLIVKEQTAREGGGGASDAATIGSSESEPQLPGPAKAGEGSTGSVADGSTASSSGQRGGLGAIPKTTPNSGGGMYMGGRRLSIEDNYPNAGSKAYNRTLSQRLSAERIPENSTAAPLITFLNYRSDVPIPPIYLPGNSALSEQQTANGFTFRRPVPLPATRPYRQLNCRLRMLKPTDGAADGSNGGGGGVGGGVASGSSTGGIVATPGADFWRDDDNNNNNSNNTSNSSYYLDALESQQARLQSMAVAAAGSGNAACNGASASARVLCNELMSGSVGEVPMNFYVTGDSDRWLHCAANVIKERFSTLNHHLHAHSHMHHHHHHRTISISGPSSSGAGGVGGVGGGGGSGLASTSASGTAVGILSSTGDDFNTASINSGSGIVDKALVASTDCSLSRGQSTIDVVQHSLYGDTTTTGGGPSVAKVIRPKRYYRFPLKFLCFREHLNISMNRLQLLALFDRDTSWAQVVLAIALCTLVSLLGSLVLYLKFYEDLYAFIFCFVIAGSQYSLLKSVQPDAASPIHGFNKTVTYSRPVYFCLCCALLLGVHRLLREYELELGAGGGGVLSIVLFGFPISIVTFLQSAQSVLSVVILSFPFLFSLGLFPQINTFTMYALEQIDMHLFGSNASCSLLASFLSVVRSVVACTLLYGLVYGALSETGTQHVLFSMYCACLVTVAYHLSRCTSDFTYFWAVIKSSLLTHSDYDSDASSKADSKVSSDSCDEQKEATGELRRSSGGAESSTARSTDEMNRDFDEEAGGRGADGDAAKELDDPLPRKLQDTVTARLKNDAVVCAVLSVATFSLHCSTVFTVLQPEINYVLHTGACLLGFLVHYVVPQLRKHLPWLCIAKPILKPDEFGLFEVQNLSKIMWFETMYVLLCFFERNILYPLIFVSALTADAVLIVDKFGLTLGTLLIVVCSLKCVRNAYSDAGSQYIILIFTVLFFRLDYKLSSETFLFDYFLISILYRKVAEFLLKLQFVVTYIAPWQITWGSAFHAFAQPFSVPHSAMLFLQTAISAILSTPLNPFLGSAIFLTSYVRPIKFWERDYNTRRIDHSNTRLSSQLERDLGADDNNLNSIFYEHLTRSLQHSLCGDLMMGRWGNVNQGDCFVLASDYLNCLVHIIELGNGLCTFQMRGLEFRGTYCQQREVEAISEEVEDNIGCCCCAIGHLPRMLSANAMFTTRWLAWQVMASKYVLEGYSISDNSATATLQVFEFRKVLISYYVKSIIFYTLRSPKLLRWLSSRAIEEALEHTTDRQFVDLDPVFNTNLDDDYDYRAAGITRASFWCVYGDWIQFCSEKKRQQLLATGHEKQQQQPPATTTPSTGQTAAGGSGGGNCVVSSSTSGPTVPKAAAGGETPSNGVEAKEDKVSSGAAPLDGWMGGVDGGANKADCGESSGTNGNGGAGGLSSNGAEATAGSSQTNGAGASNNASNGSSGGTSNPTNQFFSSNRDSLVTSLCMSLALLARRTLATASHSASCNVEFFLHGLHALFKGDFRITCPRDEWVFADMELLHGVVAPAVRMSLKLHQDHFLCPDEYDDYSNLYNAIDFHTKELVISHEADPLWRNAVLRGTPHLLALRHVMDDGSDEYRVIRLSKRFLNFRVIKLNRECVRGLWAGQQQELIYLRNRNPERGSIQNAKQALRNIINSSCDQPIGYPIYVSPLTTSYAETNAQLCRIVGGEITLEKIQQMLIRSWQRIRQRCREGCSSGSAIIEGEMTEMQGVYCNTPTPNNTLSGTAGTLSYGSQNMSISGAVAARGSMASINKPTSTTLLAGFLNRERDAEREAMAMGGAATGGGVRERSMIAKRNLGSTSKDRLEWTALQINKRDSFREVLSEAVAAASGAGGSGNESSAGADDESQSTAGGSPSSTLKPQESVESTSGGSSAIGHKLTGSSMLMLGSGGSEASGSGASGSGSMAAVGSRIPGVPGTLTFTLSPSERTYHSSLFAKAAATCPGTNQHRHWMQRPPLIGLNRKVIIVDASQIYDCLDLGRRIDVTWPNEVFRASGGRSSWKDWCPQEGMVGMVVHYWQPNHPDHHFRSNVNRTILLVEIGTQHVPIGEKGVKEYNTAGLATLVSSSTVVAPIDEPPPAGEDRQNSTERSVVTPGASSDHRSIVLTESNTTTAIDSSSTASGEVLEVTSTTAVAAPSAETESNSGEAVKEEAVEPSSEGGEPTAAGATAATTANETN